jgi:sortase A
MAAAVLSPGHAFGCGLVRIALIGLCGFGLALVAAGALIPVKAALAQLLLERAFDRSLALHQPQKPWPWADMAPVARLGFPRQGTDRIILDTGSGQAMAFAPTLLPGGARLGDPGTAVIAAHRDTHFRMLENVRAGDPIVVQTLDGVVRRYRVTGHEVVTWNRFAIPLGDERALALATCYPFGASEHGPLRYVVHAVEVTGARRPPASP